MVKETILYFKIFNKSYTYNFLAYINTQKFRRDKISDFFLSEY